MWQRSGASELDACMKVAAFWPNNMFSSWSLTEGIASVLKRMGHEVIPCPIPQTREMPAAAFEHWKATMPKVEELKTCSAIVMTGTEHIRPWLDACYGAYEWIHLGVPRASWYHESFFREDYTIDFEELRPWADEHFFPAWQDADFFDQEHFGAKGHCHWMSWGVDTEIFKPPVCRWLPHIGAHSNGCGCWVSRGYDAAFVGMMYEKRARYLNALAKHDHPPIRIGNCQIQDLSGLRLRETTELYVDNIRQVKVFFHLPTLSQELTIKVFEVLACGTFLLAPLLSEERGAHKNLKLFETGKHLVYYRPANLPYVAQLLREWPSDEKAEERERIARQGCEEVHMHHRLDQRLEEMLAKLGVKEAVQ